MSTLPDRYDGDLVGTASPLAAIRQALVDLDGQREALEEAGDYANLIYGLDGLQTLITDLTVLARATERSAAKTMPGQRVILDGMAAERGMSAAKDEWEWERLLPVLLHSAVDPDGTGEIPVMGVALDRIRKTLMACAPLTKSTAAKATGLKDRGIDAEHFRVRDDSGRRPTVRITKSKP